MPIFGAGGTTQQRGRVVKVTKVPPSQVEGGVLRLRSIQAKLTARSGGKADKTPGSNPTPIRTLTGAENECPVNHGGGHNSLQISPLQAYLPISNPDGNDAAIHDPLAAGNPDGTLAVSEGDVRVSCSSCVSCSQEC
jgi:hypothetical protein